jgi:hypothetical protein
MFIILIYIRRSAAATQKEMKFTHINCNRSDNVFKSSFCEIGMERERNVTFTKIMLTGDEIAYIEEFPSYQFHKYGSITSKQAENWEAEKQEHHYIRCELTDKMR